MLFDARPLFLRSLYTLTATFRSAVVRKHWVYSYCLISCGPGVNLIFWTQEPIFWPTRLDGLQAAQNQHTCPFTDKTLADCRQLDEKQWQTIPAEKVGNRFECHHTKSLIAMGAF